MINQVFGRFDVNNVGFITVNEFHKALRRTGKKISIQESKTMLINAGFKTPNFITKEMFNGKINDFLKLKSVTNTSCE